MSSSEVVGFCRCCIRGLWEVNYASMGLTMSATSIYISYAIFIWPYHLLYSCILLYLLHLENSQARYLFLAISSYLSFLRGHGAGDVFFALLLSRMGVSFGLSILTRYR